MKDNITNTHNKIKNYLSSFERVSKVNDVLELPDKYNHNVSFFSAKYDQEDKYNFKKFQINIQWYRNVIFIPDVGYIPFESNDEIFQQINKHLN